MRRSLSLSVAALALCAAFPNASQSQQTSYPLACRGGGQMSAVVRSSSNTDIIFLPGTAGSSEGTTPAGQCRWLDRAFRSGEPNRLVVDNADREATLYLLTQIVNGGNFFVQAYNAGDQTLRVTRVGP